MPKLKIDGIEIDAPEHWTIQSSNPRRTKQLLPN